MKYQYKNKNKLKKLQEIIAQNVYNKILTFDKIYKMNSEKEFKKLFEINNGEIPIYNENCSKSIYKEIKNLSADDLELKNKIKIN